MSFFDYRRDEKLEKPIKKKKRQVFTDLVSTDTGFVFNRETI